jgi:hypothetical protein
MTKTDSSSSTSINNRKNNNALVPLLIFVGKVQLHGGYRQKHQETDGCLQDHHHGAHPANVAKREQSPELLPQRPTLFLGRDRLWQGWSVRV